MILGDSSTTSELGGRATIDDVFRRAVMRYPDALALVDPANRGSFAGGAARRLTYAQADRAVSALACRLRDMGLQTDTVVGVQLANTVECVITLLGVMRAGMIPTLLPLLWRRADMVPALRRIGARLLIADRRIGATDHADLAMNVAAEIFPIRYVCGFGAPLPDGMVPLDDILDAGNLDAGNGDPATVITRKHNPAAHVAMITWDVTAAGLVPVARNHMEFLAGGLAVLMEGGIAQNAVILASPVLMSFSGIALTLLPWLFSAGTLVLHQPFDARTFEAQCREHACTVAVLPGALVPPLADAGVLGAPSLRTIMAAWRAPERLPSGVASANIRADLVDVLLFGEIGLRASGRSGGKPIAVGLGPVTPPRGAAAGTALIDLALTETGTVALRGAMTPHHSFPGASGMPHHAIGADGFIDTGYTCRVAADKRTMTVTGPPAGMISIGGYRFALSAVRDIAARADGSVGLSARPDPLAGYRLTGTAGNPEAVCRALAGFGANPLLIDAFVARHYDGAAA